MKTRRSLQLTTGRTTRRGAWGAAGYVVHRHGAGRARSARWPVPFAWFALLLLLALPLAACGPEEAEPEPIDVPYFGGAWHGSLTEATTGNTATVQLTVDQQGATLTGTWTAVFVSGFVNGGTLTGRVATDGSTAQVDLYAAEPGFCPMRATVEVQVGQAWGNYTTIYCDELSTGSIKLYRGAGTAPTPPEPVSPEPTPGAGVAGGTPSPGLWKAPTYTGGTAKLEVILNGQQWSLHGWGFCGGTYTSYCDWGTTTATVLSDGRLYAEWDFGWGILAVCFRLSDGNPGEAYARRTYVESGSDPASNCQYVSDELLVLEEAAAPAPEPPTGSGITGVTPAPGLWKAPDYTGGTAKLGLTLSGGQWSVHGWGFCGGTYTSYCDWGVAPATVLADGRLYVKWDYGWKTTEIWAALVPGFAGQMDIAVFDDYAPGDPRPDRWSYDTFLLAQ